jgi:hypothetical protein
LIHPSFKDIFKSSLEDACVSYKYNLSDDLKKYLVKLCAEDLLATSSNKPSGLFDSLIFLGELPHSKEILEYLKQNGDYHLSIAGYVPEAFCNKYVDFNYYISLGRYSYYRLHQKLPKEKAYKELAYNYNEIVYILNETYDIIKVHDDEYLLSIWEAWKETGHPIFRRKLIRLGLNPANISS